MLSLKHLILALQWFYLFFVLLFEKLWEPAQQHIFLWQHLHYVPKMRTLLILESILTVYLLTSEVCLLKVIGLLARVLF